MNEPAPFRHGEIIEYTDKEGKDWWRGTFAHYWDADTVYIVLDVPPGRDRPEGYEGAHHLLHLRADQVRRPTNPAGFKELGRTRRRVRGSGRLKEIGPGQLRTVIRQVMPGAPPDYADRVWAALEPEFRIWIDVAREHDPLREPPWFVPGEPLEYVTAETGDSWARGTFDHYHDSVTGTVWVAPDSDPHYVLCLRADEVRRPADLAVYKLVSLDQFRMATRQVTLGGQPNYADRVWAALWPEPEPEPGST
jgi:hypothetical protein